MKHRAVLIALLALLTLPAVSAPRHIIYLHGRIVQDRQNVRPEHPEYGHYELNAIAEALRGRGFVVSAEMRPKTISVSDAADQTVAQVRALLQSGVPADRITVLGASMGASIALRASARLQNPDVRFALLGPCLSANVPAVTAEEKAAPGARLLAIREESDISSASCASDPREIVINTGRGHGFLYRPMPEWVEPVVRWASASGASDHGPPTRSECFMLQALDGSNAFVSDPAECRAATSPASTFKIPHALIALETRVIKNARQVAKWDGTDQSFDAWERDHTIDSAMKSSVLWFFRRTAAAIGRERMQTRLRQLGYASDTFSGELTSFWVNGDLVVTPEEQLRFMQRFVRNQLPIRRAHINAVKASLVVPAGKITTAGGAHDFAIGWPAVDVVRAKTGNTTVDGERVSWLVGHIEAGKRQYVFVSRVRVRGSLGATAGAELAASYLRRLSEQHEQQHHAGHALGSVYSPVSCTPAAQKEFTRAVAILHHMTYPQAQQAFEQAAAADPKCAMAHWGIAMTLFQPLWPTRPNAEARQRGWEAVQRAKSLDAPTERERLFIAAAEAFFLDPASADYWPRIERWEKASKQAYDALPDDPEAAVFYALAHLATTPPTRITRENADRAADILLNVYRKNPQHPGAMHYLVHANDVPGRERQLLEITRKYESLAPRNPHALHMPTHIYTRLGDCDGVIRGNLLAAEAALEHPAGANGELVWDEFAHAIEYLIYASLQQGDDRAAASQLKRLLETQRIEPSFKTAFHVASTQSRYALERRAWNEAVKIASREPATIDWNKAGWPEAITRFAQGLGFAHLGNLDGARKSLERVTELEANTRKSGEELFARNIGVLRLELSAWIAHVERKGEVSRQLMQEAIELETSTPKPAVTPAPTLPAYELLGDLLLEQQKPVEALAAYKSALELYPRRFNALFGAARAARIAGDTRAARDFYTQLVEVSAKGSRQLEIDEARAYVKDPQ